MKKILSIILCAVLCLNLMSFVASAEEQYKLKDEQIALLTAVNLYNESIQLSETLTRGEFADMLVKSVFEQPEYLIEGTERFNDVDELNDYYDSIMLLKNLKVTLGDGEGNFAPNEEIKANDAIIMAVRFLGYTKLAEKTGYIPFAAQKGISKDVKYEYDDSLTMYNAYLLIYNVLTVDVSDRYVDDSASAMRNFRRFKRIEGTVTDDGFINQYGLSEIAPNEIVIDGFIYKNATEERNLFGCYVVGYYKTDDQGATIVSLIKTKNNDTLILDSKNIEKYIPQTHSYEYKENEFDDDTETIEIPKNITIIYNGVPLTIDDAEFTNESYVPVNGFVTFFDSNGDNNYDYLYINSYDTYVVSAVNTVNNIIHLKDFEKPIELKKDKYKIFNAEGEQIELSNVGEGSTLSVMKSLTGEILNVYVSNYVISDIVVAKDDSGVISTQNNGAIMLSKSYINKAYEKSDKQYDEVTEALESIEFSVPYKFYIDMFGNVAYIAPEAANLWITAAIVGAGNNSRSKLSENYEVELFGFDGTLSKFKVAEKVTFTDENNDTYRYDDETAIEKLNNYAGNEANVYRVLRYKVNLQNQITDIELPLPYGFDGLENINTDRLFVVKETAQGALNSTYYSGFLGVFLTSTDCKVLTMDSANTKNSDKYVIATVSDSFAKGETPGVVAYGTDTKSLTATNIVKPVANSSVSYSRAMSSVVLVTKISQQYDHEEMQTLYRIDGYTGKTEITLYAESLDILKNTEAIHDEKISDENRPKIKNIDVSVGDIIMYALDNTKVGKKFVKQVKVIYDADGVLADGKGYFDEPFGTIAGSYSDELLDSKVEYGNPFAFKINSTGVWINSTAWYSYPSADCRIGMGFAYSATDSSVVVTTQPINKQKYKQSLITGNKYLTETYGNIGSKIIKVKKLDSGKVKVSAGTIDDIKPYTVYGHDCSEVIFITDGGTFTYLYVFEK